MKKTAFVMKIVCASLIFVIGALLVIFGLTDSTGYSYYGSYVESKYYGGDAYTGIQQAAASTANRVTELGDEIGKAICSAYSWTGLLLMVVGVYVLACALSTAEPKKTYINSVSETCNGISSKNNIDMLVKYKSLFDSGSITLEEFEEKKKQLFGP